MKKYLAVLVGMAVLGGYSFADSDDFEGYTVGNNLTTPLSGGTGWSTDWVTANATTPSGVVQDTTPLDGGNQYLDVDLVNTAAGQAMGIGRGLADGAPGSDYTVTFKWRADVVGTFTGTNDRFEFYTSSAAGAVNSAGTGGNTTTSPYLMGVFGAARGINYLEGGYFGVYAASTVNEGFSADSYYNLGSIATGGDGTVLSLVEGTVYSFTISVHVATQKWDVYVTDGVTTAYSTNLNWWGTNPQPFIGFGCRGDTASETRSFSFDNVLVDIEPVVDPFSISVSPIGATNLNPTLTAVISDVNSEFSSAVLSLDGTPVATNSTPSGTTNTVSYNASGLSVGVHTGKVVVAGVNPTSSATNEWLFSAIPSGVYIPADYTLLEDFESYPTVAAFTNGVTTAGKWHYSIDGNTIPSNGVSTAAVGIDDFNGDKIIQTGNAPQWIGLNSDVPDIADGTNAWYFFRIKSSEQTPDSWFGLSDVPATNAVTWADFEVQVGLFNADGNDADGLFSLQARNGGTPTTVLNGIPADVWVNVQLEIFNNAGILNDTYNVYASFGSQTPVLVASGISFRNSTSDPLTTFLCMSNQQDTRSAGLDDIYFYDGTGGGGGPTLNPYIESIAVSGSDVTLTWTSESIGTYRILQKTDLTAGSWIPVVTNIPGDEPTTTAVAPVSGGGAAFYMIDGE